MGLLGKILETLGIDADQIIEDAQGELDALQEQAGEAAEQGLDDAGA